MSVVTMNQSEQLIVDSLHESLGTYPILLWGSRATGEPVTTSDYDIFVVLPAYKVPLAIRRRGGLVGKLEAHLGVGVSVNPIPAAILRRNDTRIAGWKLTQESKVLSAPSEFALKVPSKIPLTDAGTFSYLISALIYLIEVLEPASLKSESVPTDLQRGVRKALLHTAQLRLMRRGTYATSLDQVLDEVGDPHLSSLGVELESADTWFKVRNEVLGELDHRPRGSRLRRTFIVNAQYGALSALSGRQQWRAALDRRAIDTRLADAAVYVLSAVSAQGLVDQAQVEAATDALPRSLRPNGGSNWEQLRDVVVQHWPLAHPLLGL
jgi:hypothetical protein